MHLNSFILETFKYINVNLYVLMWNTKGILFREK